MGRACTSRLEPKMALVHVELPPDGRRPSTRDGSSLWTPARAHDIVTLPRGGPAPGFSVASRGVCCCWVALCSLLIKLDWCFFLLYHCRRGGWRRPIRPYSVGGGHRYPALPCYSVGEGHDHRHTPSISNFVLSISCCSGEFGLLSIFILLL